jgi:carbamoyltransferase
LGTRSILADARNAGMRDVINEKVKLRENFRPFAASVLRERVTDYFLLDADSPYMLLVAPVRDDAPTAIPAVRHVDGSARIQTVGAESHPAYRALLRKLDEKFHCPLLINTSFNIRGEPMVCMPREAYACFRRTGLDALFLENFLIDKHDVGPEGWDQEPQAKPELD